MKKMIFAALLLLLVPAIAGACPVCYGPSDGSVAKGTNNAIFFMLGTIGLVQIGFVALFWTFWRRSKALRQRREQFHLLKGGRATTT